MGLSVVVIGRNSAYTLPECLGVFCEFAQSQQSGFELLYVDSSSTDDSVNVAMQTLAGGHLAWKILSVRSQLHSAALGRYIGMQEAVYNDILFVDSDMVVSQAWLGDALSRRDHRILSGQRTEVFLSGETCWIVDRNFYKDVDLGHVTRPGGLFLLFDAHKTSARFSPYLRSEEEADFVSQDAQLHDDIYRTSEVAFVHLNRKQGRVWQKIYENIKGMPAISSYICGRIEALRRGNYRILLGSSYFYEIGAVCSMLLYAGLAFHQNIFLIFAGALILLSPRKGAVAYRSLFFPFELLFGLHHFFLNKSEYCVRYDLVHTGGEMPQESSHQARSVKEI